MKPLKALLLAAVLLTSLVVINQNQITFQNSITYANLRVRVVPGSSDQKKKDSQHAPASKTPASSESKNSQGFFCNQTNTVKAKLTVVNGGTPK